MAKTLNVRHTRISNGKISFIQTVTATWFESTKEIGIMVGM